MSESELYEQNPIADVRRKSKGFDPHTEKATDEAVASILKPVIVDQKVGDRRLGRSLAVVKPRKLTKLEAAQIAQHFPEMDPGQLPSGQNIIVQIAKPVTKSAGGIILADETIQHQEWNEQTARVIALGPLAYHNPNTGEPYREGNWCEPGDFVRIPKWGGDRSRVEGQSLFITCRDRDVISVVLGNPLTFRNRM